MSVCLEANNLTKSFQGRCVVDGLSFQVHSGEVFGLLGHNGAGKSTTIELLLGLKKPDRGQARIFGVDGCPWHLPCLITRKLSFWTS